MVDRVLLFRTLHAHFVGFYVLCFVGKVYPWPRIGLLSLGEAVWDEPAQYISMRPVTAIFGPGDFGPAGPKSPENTAGISVRGTIITRDIGPGPDILVRVADLRLGSPLRFCAGSILSLWPSTAL